MRSRCLAHVFGSMLLGLGLAACGTSTAASSVTVPPTCTTTLGQTFKEVVGKVVTVSKNQMTVKTISQGQVIVQITDKTHFTRQQVVPQSDVQDGERVQVAVKRDDDGTYTAQSVAISSTDGQPGGNRGNSGNGGTNGRQGCRTGRSGNGSSGGNNGVDGIPSGARVLRGTVASVNTQSLTITALDGQDYTVTLDSTTVYSKIGPSQASDLKTGLPVLVTGRPSSQGSITAVAVTILLALPTNQ